MLSSDAFLCLKLSGVKHFKLLFRYLLNEMKYGFEQRVASWSVPASIQQD